MFIFYLSPDIQDDREELDLRMHQHQLSDQMLLNTISSKELGVDSPLELVGPSVLPWEISVDTLPRKYIVGYDVSTQVVKVEICGQRFKVTDLICDGKIIINFLKK
jgi:hypothetical protein